MSILEKLKKGILVKDLEATEEVAIALSKVIPEDWVLALDGEMGAGKTAFTKALARAWGIEQTVTSPTYNLYLIYEGERQLIHLDAYRLEQSMDMESLMLEDFMKSPYCLVVEWATNVLDWMPEEHWTLSIQIQDDHSRLIQLKES